MKHRGFTLIELLIVVAIIAILAAIAVPNLLEAQTRARVSRVKADLRTLATGIEAYTVDNNKPMFDGHPNTEHWGWVNAWRQMTTPVAYVTSLPDDVFRATDLTDPTAPGQTHFLDSSKTRHAYDYGSAYWHNVAADETSWERWMRNFGVSAWKIGSAGPDRLFVMSNQPGVFYGFDSVYDPTNGTVSDGDIYRSQSKMYER